MQTIDSLSINPIYRMQIEHALHDLPNHIEYENEPCYLLFSGRAISVVVEMILAVQHALQKIAGQAVGTDHLSGFGQGEPLPIVDLLVGMDLFGRQQDPEIDHQGVGGREIKVD